MKVHQYSKDIFTIEDFYTPEECRELIQMSTDTGYAPATINTTMGVRLEPRYRNNTRVFHTSFELAERLWERLKDHFPISYGDVTPFGLNELFRFYRYETGEYFKPHRDNFYARNDKEASYFTFLLYLNDDYTGGETVFDDLVITPQTGMVLVFMHELMHEGRSVESGVKYVLRSDVMCLEK
ncbi:MAG: 2OG-Fe(II) oxygenase [Bacteroidetes bacterium]|nr:2OG-Fe(II) oxygenase [Bacteroidota bacterium]